MTTTTTGSAPVDEASAPPPRAAARKRRRPKTPYYLLIPAVLVLLLGLGYPVYWQVITSMQEFGLAQQFGTAPPEFVGLDNYIEIFTSDVVWVVVARSVAFCLVNAFLAVGLGTLFALLMKSVSVVPASRSRSRCCWRGRCRWSPR
ncbi:hypothetical protein GCM10025865_01650 [Paraoerskovia sediminicola]|uniref:Multiple sugar transport system permease protein n=1 Tax=Paraoerskovia sediminicola TaxID=1138587 RepID=A0ABM8FYQ1_9CELL|nr:hypothetical protein [Paraoerskovia sediminicola]BDZ40866.1 hypothetical protein GCM10025865_01650 [Paraoerskovia sediminicola]